MSESVHGPYGAGNGLPGEPRAQSQSPHAADQPRMRMRHALARLGAPKNSQAAVLDPLVKTLRANHPRSDIAVIERAYRTAEHYHLGQSRKSGDPYITHPLAVATILAELGMTETTLCAALLHDTVEDTSYTMAQLTADFGPEVATMVDGVTKLDKVTYGESAKAETLRKMVLAMSRDIRVLVIKLADRLHNMRTLGFLRQDKQTVIANETLEIFAPLAHRLGMNAIKWELEDLAFATLHPKIYDEIVRMVAARAPLRENYLRTVIDQVKEDLAEAKIKATVYGRPKHYYSIYQKMVVRGRDFFEIYDLVALRILVDANATATAPWACCMPAGTRCRAGSRTTSRCRSSTSTSPCTPRCWGRTASRWSSRSVPRRCTGRPNTASPRTGSTRRARRRPPTTWPGCGRSPNGRRRPRILASSSTRCGSRSTPPRCSCSHRRGTCCLCRRARRRSTSPTPCTPRSATGPWVPG